VVDDVRPPPPLDAIVPIDLRGRDEASCRELLLSGASAGGLKPPASGAVPSLPAGVQRPRFPGEQPTPRPAPPDLPRRVWPFVSRDDLLRQLRAGYEAGRRDEPDVVQVLCGLPGVGKTAVAIHFAHQAAAEYALVLWVGPDAGARTGARQRIDELARQQARRCLVVMDAVDDPNVL